MENIFAQRQIRYSEAVAVARNMFNYLDYDNNSVSDIATVRVFEFQESDTKIDTLLYEVGLANGAEILLSGNRACKPVLVHGYTGSILDVDDEELPCGVQFFKESYIDQIKYAFTFTDTLTYVAEWELLKVFDETQIGIRGAVVVAPLLTTKWGQGKSNCSDEEAYNYYVDVTYNNNNKCYAGCVAVAMGQIMNYWKYPMWTPSVERQFDWCNMVDSLCANNNSDYSIQKEAISWLLYKCGKAVNMRYCFGGDNGLSSGAFSNDARNAMVNEFGYSPNAYWQSFSSNNNYSQWFSLIKTNLDLGYPVIYRGLNSISMVGHVFVCDGYNNDSTFHFNFGWRGTGNYNYALYALMPHYNYDYSTFSEQQAVFYLYPSEVQDYCTFTNPLETSYYEYYLYNQNLPSQLLPHQITPKTFESLVSCPEISDSTWRIIPDTAVTEYVAHKEVILRSGFKVKRGAEFTVRIAPCKNCENFQMSQFRNVIEPDIVSGSSPKVDSKKMQIENGVILYPNPATQILTLSGINSFISLQIYDSHGKEIKCWKVVSQNDAEIKINVVQIPVGTYIIRATKMGRKSFIGKFVKQ